MKIRELEKEGIESLQGAMVPNADVDARLLMLHVLGISVHEYLLRSSDEASDELSGRYRDLIVKRCRRIPLQHITGRAEFMGLTFRVNKTVLCPRPDTEILVETVLEYMKKRFTGDDESEIRVLDLCTGSGCILSSILKLAPGTCDIKSSRITGVGSDISEDALDLAAGNAFACGIDGSRVDFRQGDLFSVLEAGELFDIIVSNPPYIPAHIIPELMPEVRDHEPIGALDGGEDGLVFYRRITKGAAAHLKDGGMLFYEIGFDQRQDVSDIMRDHGFLNIEFRKDLSDNDRVVFGHL